MNLNYQPPLPRPPPHASWWFFVLFCDISFNRTMRLSIKSLVVVVFLQRVFFWAGRYIPLWRNKGSYNLTRKFKCAFAQSWMCPLKRESSYELNEGLTRSIVSSLLDVIVTQRDKEQHSTSDNGTEWQIIEAKDRSGASHPGEDWNLTHLHPPDTHAFILRSSIRWLSCGCSSGRLLSPCAFTDEISLIFSIYDSWESGLKWNQTLSGVKM